MAANDTIKKIPRTSGGDHCALRRLLLRQVGDAEALKLAAELVRDLTDAIEIDQDLVRHIIEQSGRASDL